MSFIFEPLSLLSEAIYITPTVFTDARGLFFEAYKRSEFVNAGISDVFLQDNQSYSIKNVIRGLHYQKDPVAQSKLVRVVKGEIYDVIVDIRRGSPTYGKWEGVYLSLENKKMLYVPVGFAHGFAVISDEAIVTYRMTGEYAQDMEAGMLWDDPAIGIDWPVKTPILSSKDKAWPAFEHIDNNFLFRHIWTHSKSK